MKALFFGDVFGRTGRKVIKQVYSELVNKFDIDFVIMNGENASHGKCILPKVADEFFNFGVDVITTGNHVWDQKAMLAYIDSEPRIIRPLNFPSNNNFTVPGRGYVIVTSKKNPNLKLAVVQAMGRVFMEPVNCPFIETEQILEIIKKQGVNSILVDFHAEATSEKRAFAHFLDGKVSAVIGTHVHVQTADADILPQGTAAITDVGMCGCYDSVIGVKKELSIQKFLTRMHVRYEPAEGPGGYEAVVVDIDEQSGKSRSITTLREKTVIT